MGTGRGEAVNQQQTIWRNSDHFQELNKNPSLLETNTNGGQGTKHKKKAKQNKLNSLQLFRFQIKSWLVLEWTQDILKNMSIPKHPFLYCKCRPVSHSPKYPLQPEKLAYCIDKNENVFCQGYCKGQFEGSYSFIYLNQLYLQIGYHQVHLNLCFCRWAAIILLTWDPHNRCLKGIDNSKIP